jgi:hypothetical protein
MNNQSESTKNSELRVIPVNYRTDGYSKYCHKSLSPTRESIEKELIDPLAKGGISVIEWGTNAGTAVTYDSKIEPIVGSSFTSRDWKHVRKLDHLIHTNLKTMIATGNDPLEVAISRAHELGMKLFGRREMSKGYGNVNKKDLFTNSLLLHGEFSKSHPEYRISGRYHLDFKYKAVRDYKLSLLRELAEKGCDGIMADFQSNAIYFTDPEQGRPIMTQFIRDIRTMLDDVGVKQNRKIELFVRVSNKDSYKRGLDWKACMDEGLIDYISAFKGWPASDYFDYNMDNFIAYRNKIKSKCKVYGHIWQALGLIDTDPRPNAKKRYSKPKTVGMYIAQAALHNLSGCNGLELGFASPQQWRNFFGSLGTPRKIEFADKHYMVDIKPYLPLRFLPGKKKLVEKVKLRIADDVAKAKRMKLKVNAQILLTCSPLPPEAELAISINGQGKVKLNTDSVAKKNTYISNEEISSKSSHTSAHIKSFVNEPNWFKRGLTKISFPAQWLKQGENEIEFTYTDKSAKNSKVFEIRWIELTVEYTPKQGISADMAKNQKLQVQSKRLSQMKKLFIGKTAKTTSDLQGYTGKKAVDAIIGKWRKEAYMGNYNQLAANYGDNVDFQLRKELIVLCPQTADYLYSKVMVPTPTYRKGSRPELEEKLNRMIAGCESTSEKVLAIVRFCRDLKNKPTIKYGKGFLFGGTEEQLIEKGEDLCECLGRLFVALCEIADIPARIVMHNISGHITAEAYIDGQWGWVDPKSGGYYINKNGSIASVWDLMLYPAIMDNQAEKVKSNLHSKYNWDKKVGKCRKKYFNAKEIQGFEYYSLDDAKRYRYRLLSWEAIHKAGFAEANKKYVTAIKNVFKTKNNSALKISEAKWAVLKKKALDRKRKIIYNTDGCDALYFPKKLKATKENFIKQRLIHALGSKIDTISYCPVSSGFGYLTCKTKVGDQMLVNPSSKKARNITSELLKIGTDPLKITEEFCHKNNFEFFISLRCNDTHDTSHRKNNPHPFFSPYKKNHPEQLMGTYEKRPPHCSWSAVDFTHKDVRDRWVAIAEELMSNYDLDGLELDFCRHLQYFKSVAWGNHASEKECQMITDCMRKIRSIAERIGRKRGRPILISARLPDCIDYAKAVGLDVETWMRQKLIDIYIGGFYFQLKPWNKIVNICGKYGIKFYPSLDETRIRKVNWGFHRTSIATYRARVAAALQAGADGIYFFNIEGARNLHQLMRGDINDIRLDDKRYFISYLYFDPQKYLKNGDKYNKRNKLSQYSPVMVHPGSPLKFILEIGDDFNHPALKKTLPTVTAYADTADYDGKNLVLKVNGHKLQKKKTYGFRSEWLTQFAAPLQFFKPGVNELEVLALPNSKAKEQEIVILSGLKLLKGRSQAPWRRLFIVHDFKNSERIVNGAYRIEDSGEKSNEFANLLYPIGGIPGKYLTVRFQAKVESSSTPLATVFRMADGHNVEIVTLQPGKIGLYFIGKIVEFNTADRFHSYEASMQNGRFILKVDGKELFNEKLKMTTIDPDGKIKGHVYNIQNMHRQSLLFGSLSGKGTGAALWKDISLVGDGNGVFLKDLKFEVIFPKK